MTGELWPESTRKQGEAGEPLSVYSLPLMIFSPWAALSGESQSELVKMSRASASAAFRFSYS